MYIDFSKLFHRTSKDLSDGGMARVPKDYSDWPGAWKTIVYKSYGVLPQILLPLKKELPTLFSIIEARRSKNTFKRTPLSLEEISHILKYSCGEMEADKVGKILRAQPSGGALYPLEAYILVFQGNVELPSGIYHYNVQHHSLDILWKREFDSDDIGKLFFYEWVQGASVAIILTANFDRTKKKYGQRGYRYTLLEAGHIGQNVYLTSQALGVGCSAIVGTYDEAIEKLLGVDGENESLVYSLVLGK